MYIECLVEIEPGKEEGEIESMYLWINNHPINLNLFRNAGDFSVPEYVVIMHDEWLVKEAKKAREDYLGETAMPIGGSRLLALGKGKSTK